MTNKKLDTRSFNHVHVLREEIELLKVHAKGNTPEFIDDVKTTTDMLHWHIEQIMKEDS